MGAIIVHQLVDVLANDVAIDCWDGLWVSTNGQVVGECIKPDVDLPR